MAAQCNFESAAKGCAVNRSDDWFAAGIHGV